MTTAAAPPDVHAPRSCGEVVHTTGLPCRWPALFLDLDNPAYRCGSIGGQRTRPLQG